MVWLKGGEEKNCTVSGEGDKTLRVEHRIPNPVAPPSATSDCPLLCLLLPFHPVLLSTRFWGSCVCVQEKSNSNHVRGWDRSGAFYAVVSAPQNLPQTCSGRKR